jgi:heptosyltransferase-3
LNVLIIRPGAMGDTLMVLPSLVQLSEKALITFVGRQPGLDFVRDAVHYGLDMEAAGWHRLFMKAPDDQGLPVSQADLVVAFFSNEASNISKNLNAYFPDASIHIFPSFSPVGTDLHMARYLAECLKSAGLPVDPEKSIKETMAGRLFGNESKSTERDRIVFHPGSGDPLKNYPPDFWLKLIEKSGQVNTLQDLQKTILLGPAEEHLIPLFGENRMPLRTEISLCPDKEALKLLLRETALYLGHDSGITHLAAMLGTPSIALFRSTDVNQWRPLGPRVRVFNSRNTGLKLVERILRVSKTLIAEQMTGMIQK